MKRLAAIMAGALITTVGGVYATFNYAQGDVEQADINAQKTLAAATTTTEKGQINLSDNFTVSIDDTNNDLVTDTTISGELKISFTPVAQGADADVRENGIPLKLTILIGGTNQYNNKALFALTNAYTTGGVVLNDGNKVKDEITVDLTNYIEWKQEFALSTLDEYNAFKTAFEATTITVTVTEAK